MLDCSYAARETNNHPTSDNQEFQSRGPCACLAKDGSIKIQPRHLNSLDFFDSNIASIFVSKIGWVYVSHDGRTVHVLTYDNGPDYFQEGLARTIKNGKVGYIDHTLTEIIPPIWDFAFPFNNGLAVVCQGCRSRAVGEHFEIYGGRWGYINRLGKIIVPVKYKRESLSR